MINEYKAPAAGAVLTAENHPENRIEAAPARAPKKSTLLRSIVLSIVGGVIGMIYGVAALSSTLSLNEPESFLSVLPLVVTLVALETGYVGAIICMCKNEVESDPGA